MLLENEMPPHKALSDKSVAAARPGPKPYKLFDGGGLYVEVSPSGGKYWRLKYRIGPKERRAALGVYPEISLKVARDRAIDAKRQLSSGLDPGEQKRIARALGVNPESESFGALAVEWLSQQRATWSASHWTKVEAMLKRDLLPWLGARPIASITPPELLTVLRRIEARGAVDTTKRARIVAGQVFRFGVATGKASRDPTPDLKGAIAPTVKHHLAAITEPKAAGRLMAAIEHYEGTQVVRAALRLAPLTSVRPGELRSARWAEFDLSASRFGSLSHSDTIAPLHDDVLARLWRVVPPCRHFTAHAGQYAAPVDMLRFGRGPRGNFQSLFTSWPE